jgi:hypothetical protein
VDEAEEPKAPEGAEEPGEPEDDELEYLWHGDVPCCTGCGRPYRPGQYYCEHCGTGVGERTPYVPYVNIPFNYGPFVHAWRGLKGLEPASYDQKTLYVLLLLLTHWVVFLIGLPFVAAAWWRRRKTRGEKPPRSGEDVPET